jgi:hypothetical protein
MSPSSRSHFALAGCVDTAEQARATAAAQAEAQCNKLAKAVAWAKCKDQFVTYPDDLIQLYQAERMSIAEKVDAGSMTRADANVRLAQLWSQIMTEHQRGAAQATAAEAAVLAATAPRPQPPYVPAQPSYVPAQPGGFVPPVGSYTYVSPPSYQGYRGYGGYAGYSGYTYGSVCHNVAGRPHLALV